VVSSLLALLGVAVVGGPTRDAQAASPTEAYVTQVYQDLLGRAPDAAGSAYWVNLLTSGVPRPAVASALVVSNEYRGLVIGGMYQQYLGRSPDAAGLAYWVGQVGAGMTFEQFQTLLIGSDEYYGGAQKGNGSPSSFVAAMYHDVLGRSVDASGLSYFTGLLNSGWPRPMVVGAVVYSAEHLRSTVNGYYQHFLHRDADSGGLAYWTMQLQAGARDEVIVALIIGSDEYFARSSTAPTTTTTTGPKLLPDLVLTSVSASPVTPQAGQVTNFTATVKNQGNAATPGGVPVGVSFAVDGAQVSWGALQAGGLAPGASIVISTTGTPNGGAWTATAGNHTLGAYVDQNPPGSPPVNRITESNENNNTRSVPFTVTAVCGMTVTTNVVLANDITCPAGATAITVTTAVTIDLNGHTIAGGPATPSDYPQDRGILVQFGSPAGSDVVTVKNGSIRGFSVAMDSYSGLTVDSVRFAGNRQGILVSSSDGAGGFRITKSTFDGAGVDGSSGISFSFGGPPVYIGSNSFANLGSGVSFGFWGPATIENNTFTNAGTAISGDIVNGFTIAHNDVHSSDVGIDLSSEVEQTSVVANTIHDNRIGIRLAASQGALHGGDNDNAIRSNTLTNNGAAGIVVIDTIPASNLAIDSNTATGNGFAPAGATNAPIGNDPLNDGIYVYVLAGSTVSVTNNITNHNADHGIEAVGVTTSSGNTAVGNGSTQCVGVTCT
jgi:hypothetical protein